MMKVSFKLRGHKVGNKKFFLVFLLPLFLAGCATKGVSKNEMQNAYYGQKPNEQEKIGIITEYVKNNLIDPDSLKLRCSSPRKGWARPFNRDPVTFGYVFACGVNAKNRMGGYSGERLYVFLFNDRGQQVFTNENTARGPLERGLEFDYVE